MRVAAIVFVSLLFVPAFAQQKTMQVRPLPDEAVRQNTRLASSLSLSAKAKVQTASRTLAAVIKQKPKMNAAQMQAQAHASVAQAFPSLRDMDIDAIVFLVMTECAQDQQSDLDAQMNQMQQANAQKQAMRNEQNAMNQQQSDLSQQMQLELQMEMDQRSKLLEAISNVMKTASDTQSAVIANMK